MRHRGGEADQRAVEKDRRKQEYVGQMLAAVIGVVVDVEIKKFLEYHDFGVYLAPVVDSCVLAGSGASTWKIYIILCPKNPETVYGE